MADRLKQIWQKILEIWYKYTKKQKSIIISTIAVVIIAMVILVVVLNRPNLVVLTSCSSYNEMNQVTQALTEAGYTPKVEDGSMTVKVKKSDLTNAKMALAAADIKADGYTFEDSMTSSFSTTESDKQKQYQHYLENKFADDLSAIDGVKSASVTVILGDNTNTFYATTAEASVSAVLELSTTINDDKAANIADFLRTSVGNKNTEKITIISTTGDTLFSGADTLASGSNVSYNSQQKHKAQIESTVKSGLKQSLLATGLFDDAYIVPNYVMDWNTVNKIATEYSTNEGYEQGLYKESYVEKSSGGTGSGGSPGTNSNGDDDTTYNVTDGDSSSSYQVEKYSYLPNELVTTTNVQPGSIIYDDSSMAVTFIKNMMYNEVDAKKLGYLDGTTWEEFKANNSEPVVINVDNNWVQAIASGSGIEADNITVLAYQRPFFVDSPAANTAKTVTFWVQIALAAAILGLLAFVLIRSARPLTVEEREPELSVEEMLATTKEKQLTVDEIDINEKSETRKAIEKFVDENPEAVALLLRNWLNDGWD